MEKVSWELQSCPKKQRMEETHQKETENPTAQPGLLSTKEVICNLRGETDKRVSCIFVLAFGVRALYTGAQ